MNFRELGGCLLLVTILPGCPIARNRAISTTRPGTLWDAQNETSIVRVPNGVSPGHDRLIVGYHDFSGTKEMVDGGYQLINGASRMAWAHSDDLGQTWIAHPNIPADNADAGEVISLRGDPYLAQVNGTVFYLALASTSPTGVVDRLALARLPANSLTFEPFRTIVRAQPGEGNFDGPKLAITADGQDPPLATIAWWPPASASTGYVVLSNLFGDITTVHRGLLTYPAITHTNFASPAGCVAPGTISNVGRGQDPHPAVAIGMSGMAYIGVRSRFSAVDNCNEIRLEVYRANLRTAGPLVWERILSRPSRPRFGKLNSSGSIVSRQGIWGTIGVSRLMSGGVAQEVVSLISEQESLDVLPEENAHYGLQFIRLPDADLCAGGGEGCNFAQIPGAADFDPELDYGVQIRAGTALVSLSNNRPGVSRTQPTLVTHPNDSRVAAFWYAQPYVTRASLPPNTTRFLTTIEGVFSANAGQSFGPLRRIAVISDSSIVDPADGGVVSVSPTTLDASASGFGMMFDPCQYLVRPGDYMFGDYISGTFLNGPGAGGSGTGVNPPYQVYGTWSDSRHGCVISATVPQSPVSHHHVFGGAW